MSEQIAGAVVGLIVTAGATALIVHVRGDTPTIAEQVADIRVAALKRGESITFYRRVPIRPGMTSDIFVVAPRADRRRSSELRVYDEQAGKLQMRLSFRPQADFRTGDEGLDLVSVQVRDLDGDGSQEIIGSYAMRRRLFLPISFPVAFKWSDKHKRFKLHAVRNSPPRFVPAASKAPPPGSVRPDLMPLRLPLVLDDPASRLSVRAYAVRSFAIVGSTIVYAFDIGPTTRPDRTTLQVEGSQILDVRGDLKFSRMCLLRRGVVMDPVPALTRLADEGADYSAVLSRMVRSGEVSLLGFFIGRLDRNRCVLR